MWNQSFYHYLVLIYNSLVFKDSINISKHLFSRFMNTS
uniref:Uncharacterized protein n=1 Tax=Rhizophora mucronata TaxID=61149 RepID=A0A2P2IY69_RHIMU